MEKFLKKFEKLPNWFASDFISRKFLMKFNWIDWSFVENLEKFGNLQDFQNFFENKNFEELYYVNDCYFEDEFLIKKEDFMNFLDFALKELPGYHYFCEKNWYFIIQIVSENYIFYWEYNPKIEVIYYLQNEISIIQNNLKKISDQKIKKELIEKKKSFENAIWDIKFCEFCKVSPKNVNIDDVIFLKNLENSWWASNIRIMCDFETEKREYWQEIEKLLLFDGDIILRKK